MREKKITIRTIDNRTSKNISPKQQIRTAVYCRVSTNSPEQISSYNIQKDSLEQFVWNNPKLIFAGMYGDLGSSGGSLKNREEFNRMLEDCRQKKIDLIITKSISRFARNLSDAISCIRELQTLNIPVYFEKEHLYSLDSSAEMVFAVLAAIAQEELNHHSRDIKWSLLQRAKMGIPVHPSCFGYRKDPNGTWKIFEPEAKKIRLIFQMALKEELYDKLIQELNFMEQLEESNYIWNKDKIYRILKREIYTGCILTHQKISIDYLTHKQIRNHGYMPQYYIRDHHEAIISKHDFDQVQMILRARCRNYGNIINDYSNLLNK